MKSYSLVLLLISTKIAIQIKNHRNTNNKKKTMNYKEQKKININYKKSAMK